jgi:hypothetical protein
MAALGLAAAVSRKASIDRIDEVLGCANQAGEDNRNVAYALAARGLPVGLGRHGQPALRVRRGRRSQAARAVKSARRRSCWLAASSR